MTRDTERDSLPALAVCTIVAKNHLPRARALANSFLRFHSDVPFFVLLVDRVDYCFDPAEEKFRLLQIDELQVPDLDRLSFQYSLFELSCAVKPHLFHFLFSRYGFRKLIYFDSDILVLRGQAPLISLLDDHSIILTPHLDSPLPDDGLRPSEVEIMQAGTINAGFLAMGLGQSTQEFLTWWKAKLRSQCLVDPVHGLYVDQKWLDLVPGAFRGVHILRDPGYNIAYWNLPIRQLLVKNGSYYVNDEPAYFFHFSGFNPESLPLVSAYTDRYNIENVGVAANLYRSYVDLLMAYGHQEAKAWGYSFGYFDNGLKIPDAARRMYRVLGEEARRFGNPFKTASSHSFFNWLAEPIDNESDPSRMVTRLWYELYESRPDLQRAFPEVLGRDRESFIRWTMENGLAEYAIADRFAGNATKLAAKMAYERNPRPHKRGGRFGVNVLGPVASEKGVGEAVRSTLRILDAVGISYALHNFEDPSSSNVETTFVDTPRKNSYRITLAVNGVEAVSMLSQQRRKQLHNHYSIGHWAWELEDFPRSWHSYFNHFDEIWVASSFIQSGLERISPVPVLTLPYSVAEQPLDGGGQRFHFGLPKGVFVFLFMFDFHSYIERKNPLGLIKAFKKAFGRDDRAMLLLKSSHSRDAPDELRAVQKAARGANVRIYDCVLGREQVRHLMNVSDCYVSLHRSEGFGLTLAEAMSMGKPVVATGYSGNMDFMTARNSYPVQYKLVPIERDHGPYKRGFVWAEAELDHAAQSMRFVYENRDAANEIGLQARRDVLANLSPLTIGTKVKDRLVNLDEALR